jgi:Chaperone of endosialidase
MGGADNTATGAGALGCFNGSGNTANGANALVRCRPTSSGGGSNNTVMGAGAFSSGDSNEMVQNNTVIGAQALRLPSGGNNNIAIGYQVGANLPFGDNNIEIGNAGEPAGEEGPTIRIGDVQTRAFIAGIRGVTTQKVNAVPVLIDSAGQLGTMSSSQRYKREIKPMDRASESILALKPVSFHYTSDKTNTPQFGLIAEQVAEVNPELVVRDNDGEIYTVRYDAVNAMLLNEFLKEHRKVEEQQATITQLKQELRATAARQQTQIEALTAGLQKVNAQLEQGRNAPQMVLNDR